MDASLVGAPVFKTVCVALILSQVGSIPTHLRHVCEDCYDVDNVYEKNLSTFKEDWFLENTDSEGSELC